MRLRLREEGSGREEGAFPADAFVVPVLLLLIARDLLLFDPPRVLAWRFLHDPRLAAVPSWLSPFVPRPSVALDRDPVALLLGGVAAALAIVYLAAGLLRARAAVRGALLGVGALSLVVVPTLAFIAMGFATDRPYGQDGGVVQLPLALERILAGTSPYGADYSDSILGKQARVSEFWAAWGGNPILRHHAYLPGTHLVMMPFYLLSRAAFGAFDPRFVTLLAYVAAALLAFRVGGAADRGLAGAAVVALNPLVYWHQVFGAGDVVVGALLLLSVVLAARDRPVLSGAALGLACAAKQLAWPFAPFLLVHLSGARSFRELLSRPALGRLARPALAAGAVFAAAVVPVAALDFRAFWGDIVVYNVGLPGADNYPLGGTPGFGFANFLIYFGAVASLKDTFPFGVFYALLLPLGLLLLRHQMRRGGATTVFVTGGAALLASLYFSRVVHPNYLILAAMLIPVGFLGGRRRDLDVAVVPLLLLSLAVEIAEQELFRAVWEDALSVRLPAHLSGLAAVLAPRAGPGLTRDPLGLLFSASAAGLGILWLIAGVLGAPARLRLALAAVALAAVVVVPTLVLVRVGEATGIPRGQDPWMSGLSHEARRAAGQTHPIPPLQAWSASFRRDPPAHLVAEDGITSPGEKLLGLALGRAGLGDPRRLTLFALVVVAALLVYVAPAEGRPLALGAALLSPVAITGVTFGSGDVALLAAVLGCWCLERSGRLLAAGLVLGLAAAVFPRILFAAPFLLLASARARGALLRAVTGALLGFSVLALPLQSPKDLLAGLAPTSFLAPGIGLPNLRLYAGGGEGQAVALLAVLLPAIIVGASLLLALRTRVEKEMRLTAAAALLLIGLWLTPGASPHDLGVPLVLALFPVLLRGR